MSPANRVTCASFLEELRKHSWAYEELVRHKAIRPSWEGETFTLYLSREQLPLPLNQWIDVKMPHSLTLSQEQLMGELVGLLLETEVAVNGPKIFRPNLDQCVALEQIAPRVHLGSYVQPYRVMMVQLPEDYRKMRVCPPPPGTAVDSHSPACVLIGLVPPPVSALLVNIVFDSGRRGRLTMTQAQPTIEHSIIRDFGENSYANPGLLANERLILANLLRLSVNAMLLLTVYGCKALGPVNAGHYHRLEHFVETAKKRGRGLPEAQRELRQAPQLFGFAQDIVLHDEARTDGETSGSGDGHRRPHFRRGHVKTHAHGPGRSLRKFIFIKPVFVNRHLWLGGDGSGETTYRIG